jgi:N-acetylneuraminic acid mutarotase
VAVGFLASACTLRGPGSTTPAPAATSAPDLAFSDASAMPAPRTEVAAAALDGFIYTAGGLLRSGNATDEVDVYNPAVDKWSASIPLPEPLHHTSLVATAGRLYVIGGYRADGSATEKVWSRGPDDRTWRHEPPLRTPRGAFGAAADAGGRIYVFGGASRFEPLGRLVPTTEMFDPRQGFFRMLGEMPQPRDHLAAASVGNTILAIGGRDLSYAKNTARVDIFNARTNSWRRGPELRKARGGIAAAAVGTLVCVFGGEDPSGTFPKVECLDVRHGRWREGPDLPTPRHGLGAAEIEDRVYVVGGGPRPGISVSGANEVLEVHQG